MAQECGTLEQRQTFYQQEWGNWHWRWVFRLFFSRWVMGLGRDPSFFKYVQGSVGDRILDRTCYALTALNPAENPYLQWILTGQHLTALPYALRPENFDAIRNNLDRLEWHCVALENFLEGVENAIDRYNLSNIFEYLSLDNYHQLLQRLIKAGRSGGRLAYWNMLVPRSRPATMIQLQPLTELGHPPAGISPSSLHAQDKAFFYSAFIVEEITKC